MHRARHGSHDPAKLASASATRRSPAARSVRASTAAIASRLIHHTPRSRLCIWSSGSASPSEASLDLTPVLPRTKSFGCCLDPPQLLAQLARGSKPLRGRTLARSAGEAPAVAISTASAHLLGASIAPRRTRGHPAALLVHAPTSVDQRPENSLQMTRAFARSTSMGNRGMPSKSRHFARSDGLLCKQEVTGSNPVGSTEEKACS